MLTVPGGWGSHISRQTSHEGGKVVSPTHRPLCPQDIFLVFISDKGRVDPRTIVRPERLCQWKIPMTPSGIEPATFCPMGARFSALVHTVPGAHPASYTMGTGFFPGVKRPERGVDHATSSSAEVKERVELYRYSPSGPSWPVIGLILPLPLPLPFPKLLPLHGCSWNSKIRDFQENLFGWDFWNPRYSFGLQSINVAALSVFFDALDIFSKLILLFHCKNVLSILVFKYSKQGYLIAYSD
jgi:hypothetical protein